MFLKRLALITTVAGGVIALAGAGWLWWHDWRFVETTDNAYVESDILVISPRVGGHVRDVLVEDNQPVAAGQVLAVLDDRKFAAALAAAEAAVAVEQASLGTSDRLIRHQQSIVDEAAAALASATAEHDRVEQDYTRYQHLFERKLVSQQKYQIARADQGKADADLRRATAILNTQRERIAVLGAERKEIEARLQRAAAEARLAATELDETVIHAPSDGVVGNLSARVGQFVEPGRQLMYLVPLSEVYVVANFKETQIEDMHPGAPARLEFDAYPDHPITARIASFAPASGAEFSLLPAQNATGNFTKIVQRVPIKITLPDDNPLTGRLRPGLSVTVSVDTRSAGVRVDPGPIGLARAAEAVRTVADGRGQPSGNR